MNWLKLVVIALILTVGLSSASCGAGGNSSIRNSEPAGNGSNTVSYYISRYAPSSSQPFNDLTALQLVSQIKLGWNLGNTLDTYNLTWLPSNAAVSQMETAWGNPVTTQANIDAIKAAGFNAIRIPVSWAKAANSNYIIRSDWMDRVTQVVNYAVNNDLYIVLNTHHDEEFFKFTNAAKAESLKAFRIIWEQIAENFKNYNEKLIFEGLNEPRTKGSANEWTGGIPQERSILNEYYQVFVDTVRASGGNNERRILMINTYAASALPVAVNSLDIPNDPAANKIIVSIHAYAPWEFALKQDAPFRVTWDINNPGDTNPITAALNPAYERFISRGIPVIMGEFGAVDRNNLAARTAWIEYYVKQAADRGIPCFIWDNGLFSGNGEIFGFFNRRTNEIMFPTMLDAMKRGAGI